MRTLIIAAAFLLPVSACATHPVNTYGGPLGGRVLSGATCTVTSIRDRGVALPRIFGVRGSLAAGQYRNPTDCAVEGAPAGPQF